MIINIPINDIEAYVNDYFEFIFNSDTFYSIYGRKNLIYSFTIKTNNNDWSNFYCDTQWLLFEESERKFYGTPTRCDTNGLIVSLIATEQASGYFVVNKFNIKINGQSYFKYIFVLIIKSKDHHSNSIDFHPF